MSVKGEQRLIRTKPISQEEIDAGIVEGYYPSAEGGPIALFKKDDPFSLLHELSHARAGHKDLKPFIAETLQREIEAAEHLVYQLVDAGVWNKNYKEDLIESLASYFELTQGRNARAAASKIISDFERKAK